MILDDVETILRETLKEHFGITGSQYKVRHQNLFACVSNRPWMSQEHSIVLVIPDFYDRAYVQSMVRIFLVVMGFKQLCVQQVTSVPYLFRD